MRIPWGELKVTCFYKIIEKEFVIKINKYGDNRSPVSSLFPKGNKVRPSHSLAHYMKL